MTKKSIPPDPPEFLTKAVQWALRPIIRLLLHLNITLPTLVQWIKALYVEIADREFRLPGKTQTDSRISLLTGVHRKDVKQFRQQADHNSAPPTSRTAQMLALWTSAAPFYDKRKKQPKPLAIQSDANGSFNDLVTRVSRQDIRPRAVLDQWLDADLIEIDNGKAMLKMDRLGSSPQQEEQALFFGKIIHDHIQASGQNLITQPPPHLDRCVYYNNLSEASIEQLRDMAETESMKLLQRINQEARRLQKQDSKTDSSKHRFTYGTFFYHTEQTDETDQTND